jgi:hypothetical protein
MINRIKILDFVKDMQKKASGRLKEVSGSGKCFEKTINFQGGQADIIMIRGGAIEKVLKMLIVLWDISTPNGVWRDRALTT